VQVAGPGRGCQHDGRHHLAGAYKLAQRLFVQCSFRVGGACGCHFRQGGATAPLGGQEDNGDSFGECARTARASALDACFQLQRHALSSPPPNVVVVAGVQFSTHRQSHAGFVVGLGGAVLMAAVDGREDGG